jgi:protein-S-isoprenylcysteine O-methyltransferase Ste14
MSRYKKWASREYSLKHRLLALIPAGFLFLLIFPYLLVILLPRLDTLLHLPNLFFGLVNFIFGGLLLVLGGIYGFWSIYSQLSRASGTPLPMMPTQKLLIDGPFKQCRNPMTFGTITAYLGVGVMVGSLSSIVFILIIGGLLLTYIKKFEEGELEARFGQDYIEYKKTTPLIIPKHKN